MQDAQVDFHKLLTALSSAEVEFIVVGGVCAALHGAPVSTFDLYIVYSRTDQNLARLEEALQELEASYRMKPGVSPDARRLDTPGHHQLMTRFGPLDLLGSTVRGQSYQDLLGHTEEINLAAGNVVRILDLATLIRIKESLARERDLAMLPVLRRTLKERGCKA